MIKDASDTFITKRLSRKRKKEKPKNIKIEAKTMLGQYGLTILYFKLSSPIAHTIWK